VSKQRHYAETQVIRAIIKISKIMVQTNAAIYSTDEVLATQQAIPRRD